MKRKITILRSLWSKLAFFIGTLASLAAILTVDFSPPLPTTSVEYLNVINERFLADGQFRAFVAEANPELLTREMTPADLDALNIPDNLKASRLIVNNHGDIEIEDLTTSFTFYKDAEAVFTEQFAGELTIGPGRAKSSDFPNPEMMRANFIEVCLKYNGVLPFSRVTERFLMPFDTRLANAFNFMTEYDRSRSFFITKKCHTPPLDITMSNNVQNN
jgi:hypothetical protein